MPSGKLHVQTEHCEYLIDTNKKLFQRAVKTAGKQFVVDGDWKTYSDFELRPIKGGLELVVQAPDFKLFSGLTTSVEEVA